MTPLGGSPTSGPSGTTPPSQPSMQPGAGGVTPGSPGAYPKTGHAPGYSWIAGRVVFTRIQGGCIFIDTRDAADVPTLPAPVATGPIVSTAVAVGTSPPLREITPVAPPTIDPSAPQGPVFSPNGAGWDSSAVKDGDYVVAFGHVAGPGDLRQMCPGGTPYIVDRMQPNP